MEYYFWLGNEAPKEAKSDFERWLISEKNEQDRMKNNENEHIDYPPVDYVRE